MPNICNNTLIVNGSEEDIVKFLQQTCTAENFETAEPYDYAILRKLVPTPQELTDTVSGWSADPETQAEYDAKFSANLAKYGYKDWYDWNIANWGTKWADSDTFLSNRNTGYCVMHFQTPWCAPEAGIDKVSVMFPNLEFVLTYMEEGAGFVGATAYKSGMVAMSYNESIHVDEYSEDADPDDFAEAISNAYFEAVDKCEAHVMMEAGFNHAKV